MAKAKVTFHQILQDSQNYGSFDKNEDHMVSVVQFSLEVDGERHEDMYAEVCQPYGTDYEQTPVEVGRIQGPYKGPWNHNTFSALCEKYYRSQIGPSGSAIRISGAKDVRMRNNILVKEEVVEFDLPEEGSGAW